MDSAENGLAVLLQLLEKIENGPGRLRIETGSGFIQEQQQLWLRGQLDANGESLSLLDVETFAGHADNRIGVLVHVE